MAPRPISGSRRFDSPAAIDSQASATRSDSKDGSDTPRRRAPTSRFASGRALRENRPADLPDIRPTFAHDKPATGAGTRANRPSAAEELPYAFSRPSDR